METLGNDGIAYPAAWAGHRSRRGTAATRCLAGRSLRSGARRVGASCRNRVDWRSHGRNRVAGVTRAISISLLGEPCAWRHRTSADGKHRYLPAKQRNVSSALRLKAEEAMISGAMLTGPVRLHLLAEFAIPDGWSARKRNAAILGDILPAKKPDLDNLMKLVGDCLSKIVISDDKLICEAICRKRYSTQPKIVLTIEPMA